MEKDKLTKEKREALIDSILAETEKKPYKPSAAPVRQSVGRQEPPRKPAEPAEIKQPPVPETAPEIQEQPVRDEISEKKRISEVSKMTAEKIERIRREKHEAQKSKMLIPEQQRTEIPQPEYSEPPEEYDEYEEYDEQEFPEKTEKNILSDILDIAEYVITAAFIIILVFTYIFSPAEVSGASMEPTLKDGDTLLVMSAGYSAKTGDVVVIDDKNSALLDENNQIVLKDGLGCKIVKRVIAVGGDTIDFDFENGIVNVNGTPLEESYISEPTTRDEFAFEYPLTVPEGYVFVMGDNRNISKDSRHPDVGLVPEDDITGKVILRVYPFSDFGTVK